MKLWIVTVVAGSLSIFAAPFFAIAQQAEKIAHLGYMSPGDIPRYDSAFLRGLQQQGYIFPGEVPRYDEAFWRGLTTQGFFEGKRIRIEIRATAERYPERVPAFAAELVNLNVDVLFAATPAEAKAAQQAVQRSGKSIPIVFGPGPDPVGAGLVASLARPGGNITGLLLGDPEFEAKRLEILKETFPNTSRVAYLRNPSFFPLAMNQRTMQAVQAAAKAKGIRLHVVEVRMLEELDGAFARILRGRPDAIMVSAGPVLLTARRSTVEFAAKHRLPAMYSEALFVDAGGLMFYGSPYAEWSARAAAIVAKILKGTKPADIPVEQPRDFKLLINSKSAKMLRSKIPESILLRAEMIETLEP